MQSMGLCFSPSTGAWHQRGLKVVMASAITAFIGHHYHYHQRCSRPSIAVDTVAAALCGAVCANIYSSSGELSAVAIMLRDASSGTQGTEWTWSPCRRRGVLQLSNYDPHFQLIDLRPRSTFIRSFTQIASSDRFATHSDSNQTFLVKFIFLIFHDSDYTMSLIRGGLDALESRRDQLTERFFQRSVLPETSCLHYLLHMMALYKSRLIYRTSAIFLSQTDCDIQETLKL